MKNTLFYIYTFALLGAPALAAPAAPAPDTVEKLSREYLDGLFAAKPHFATFMGVHARDGELPDLSDQVQAAREAELAALERRVTALPRAGLSLDQRIDLDVMSDGIGLELLYLREIQDWTWDPRLEDSFPYYDPREIVAGRLSDIVHGTFAPEPQRRRSVIAELLALPRFLEQKKRALKTVSKVALAQAVKDNLGRIEFFETDLKEFLKADAAGENSRIAAVAALRDYQAFLGKELPARATHEWKLGAALYRKKFPLALQTRVTTDEARTRATRRIEEVRAELAVVGLRLWKTLWPKEPPPTGASAERTIIARVKDGIARDHGDPRDLVKLHAQHLDALRAFLVEKDLLALPPRETLSVEPMPIFKRGVVAAEYLSPGMLDRASKWRATYYVDPIDPTWPADKVESYMRANNDYLVELTAAHEAYPGHHTQAWYAVQQPDDLRSTLWNGPMAEGWAVYGEDLITRLGYGGARADRYRFTELKGQLGVAANLILDIGLQSGTMSGDEAVTFLVEQAFQERAQAEKKLLRAQLDSTQLAQYFLGYSELQDLEQEVRTRQGKAYSQRAFDEAVIGHGSLAVKHLRELVLRSSDAPLTDGVTLSTGRTD